MQIKKDTRGTLLQTVARKARLHRKSIRTEKAYLKWILDYLRYHRQVQNKWIHPAEMNGRHVSKFLEYLAVERKVAKSTQNQAFSALLFLYRVVLETKIEIDAPRAKQTQYVPVVMSVDEVRQVMDFVPSSTRHRTS